MLERDRVGRVAIIGFSGGLSPGLSPGALLVAERIIDDASSAPTPDRAWSDRLAREEGVRSATLVTVDHILCTPRSKMELWDGLSQSGPAAADLETAAMASVAASHGVPFVVIRAISDPVDEALPLDFNECLDGSGRISRAKVVGRAAMKPALIAPLWRLHRRARSCSERLADLVCRSIEGEPS
jgi:adenosylhomocysteine nucleosidase